MKYADIKYNDVVNGEGVNVSFWVQGCPHHCKNCHNPEQWDFNKGKEFTIEVLNDLKQAIVKNNIKRNLSILGGEPLCPENLFLTTLVIKELKQEYPDLKIYVWTGYVYEDLLNNQNPHLKYILNTIDVLIDGPYIESLKDLTLPLRGSKNQRIIQLKN